MSQARMGTNWADVDEDDEDVAQGAGAAKFETKADEHGVKMVIEYKERDGKTYKVTRRVKQTVIPKKVNALMNERKELAKFGKVITNDPKEEASHVKHQEDEIQIDLTKKAVSLAVKDDAEDKFLDEAFKATETLFKEKRAWADANRALQMARDHDDGPRPADTVSQQLSADLPKPKDGTSAYVPPSMRGGGGKDGGKGDGKGKDGPDASLRVTNLSETAREGDLQELFGRFGRLARVYIARDMETKLSRGFAFITYYNTKDAQAAINGVNGHGYDNLIMQVQWAKPRA